MRNRPVWDGWMVRAAIVAAAAVLSARGAMAGDGAAADSSDFGPALAMSAGNGGATAGNPNESSAMAGGATISANPFTLDEIPTQTVYGEPQTPTDQPGVNAGGTHVQLDFDYYNHYVYRGVDHSLVGGRGDSANVESQAQINFDIKQFTPFVGVFSNVFDSDPLSRFQEIRPYFGGSLNLHPLTLSAGDNAYLFLERRAFDTSEVWGKFEFDDGYMFGLDKPIFSPSIYGAYDYDKNKGWYFEAAVRHDFTIEQTGVTISPYADVGYIYNYQEQFVYINNKDDTGFQHYDVGVIVTYALNSLLNIPMRYGDFDLTSRIVETGKIRSVLDADNVFWGGVGVEFRY